MSHPEPLPREGAAEPEAGTSKVRLFLRMPEVENKPKLPSWLARFFYLDVYSSPLLTEKVRREMNLAAILLLIVTCFELAMWTSLFNFIYNSEVFYHGPKLIFAFLTACLFAMVIFYFERQMVVHDDVSQGRASWAMVTRVTYILVAAFITSQPFDLILLDQPIRTRIHEEEVRRDAIAKLSVLQQLERDLEEMSTAALGDAGPDVDKPSATIANRIQTKVERGRLSASTQRIVAAQQRVAGDLADIRGLRERVQAVQNELHQISRSPISEETLRRQAQLQGEGGRLQSKIGALQVDLVGARSELADAEREGREAIDDLAKKKQQSKESIKATEEEITKYTARLTAWIQTLSTSKPGDKIVEPHGDWRFEIKDSRDFLQKLRVLYDLLAGRTPQWIGGTPAAVARLRHDFNLHDPQPCRKASEVIADCDPEEWARHQAETEIYFKVWLIGILVAVFIPFLIVTIKRWLFPADLRIFYSRHHQALAGEPEAALVNRVDERVKQVSGRI